MQPGVVGRNLARILEQRGRKPTWLSKVSGVPRSTITSIMSGYSPEPHLDTVRKLAVGLGIDDAELTAREEPQGFAELDAAIEEFLESRWADYLQPRPSDDEIDWLRSLGRTFWLRVPPNAEALHHLVKAHRSGKL